MKYTVELDWESASNLVKHMLIEDYNMVNKPDSIDNSDDVLPEDKELVDALDVVIKYYSTPTEYKAWKSSLQEKD